MLLTQRRRAWATLIKKDMGKKVQPRNLNLQLSNSSSFAISSFAQFVNLMAYNSERTKDQNFYVIVYEISVIFPG